MFDATRNDTIHVSPFSRDAKVAAATGAVQSRTSYFTFSCTRLLRWTGQLLFERGADRFVDRGLGDLPDQRAHDGKHHQISRGQW